MPNTERENYKLPKLTRMQAVMLMRLITCEIQHQELRLAECDYKDKFLAKQIDDIISQLYQLREQLHEQGIAYYQQVR